jgi:hypothetical protein
MVGTVWLVGATRRIRLERPQRMGRVVWTEWCIRMVGTIGIKWLEWYIRTERVVGLERTARDEWVERPVWGERPEWVERHKWPIRILWDFWFVGMVGILWTVGAIRDFWSERLVRFKRN